MRETSLIPKKYRLSSLFVSNSLLPNVHEIHKAAIFLKTSFMHDCSNMSGGSTHTDRVCGAKWSSSPPETCVELWRNMLFPRRIRVPLGRKVGLLRRLKFWVGAAHTRDVLATEHGMQLIPTIENDVTPTEPSI